MKNNLIRFLSRYRIIITIIFSIIVLFLIIIFYFLSFEKYENIKEDTNITKDGNIFNNNLIEIDNEKFEIKNTYTECYKNKEIIKEKIYEDLILKKFSIKKDFLNCVTEKNSFGRENIKKGDIYITNNGVMVIYNGTKFVGGQVIKITGQ